MLNNCNVHVILVCLLIIFVSLILYCNVKTADPVSSVVSYIDLMCDMAISVESVIEP